MGNTPEGRDWCLKALHPSDALNAVRGIPDESSVPSCFMGYQTCITIGAPSGSVGAWGFDLTVLPHPVNFASIYTYDESVAHTAIHGAMNAQLSGTTHLEKYTSFRALAQRWRLAYAGVTVSQDAAALTNQGTIAACQTAAESILCTYVGADEAYTTPFGGPVIGALRPMQFYQTYDKPNFARCQSMPNGYVGLSKEGLYMPLRLTRTHQQWHSAHDEVVNCGVAADVYPFTEIATAADDTMPNGWPFDEAVNGLPSPVYNTTTSTYIAARPTSSMCSNVFGHICAQNLALTTRYTLFFRFGFELQVQPGSLLSPQQTISPKYDPMALEAYFMISRELKDAYPEEYNSLGELWDVISSAAKSVAPALAAIPGIGPLVGGVVHAAASAGDSVRNYFKSKKDGKDTASAADVERVKEVMAKKSQPTLKQILAPPKKKITVQRRNGNQRK